jgi:hypothetical protein
MGVSDKGDYRVNWSIRYGKGRDTGSFTGSDSATGDTNDDAHINLIDTINSSITPTLSDIKKFYDKNYINVREVIYNITLTSETFSTT